MRKQHDRKRAWQTTQHKQAREQHDRKGGGRDNNPVINVTGWGKEDAREAELQDRKVARVQINTGPEEDTTQRKHERVSKQQKGGA